MDRHEFEKLKLPDDATIKVTIVAGDLDSTYVPPLNRPPEDPITIEIEYE